MVLCAAPTRASTCDTDFVRVQAEHSVCGYEVEAVRVTHGIVSLLFRRRGGTGSFAIALYASGTRLSTSTTRARLDRAEVTRAAAPISAWWQNGELQRTLAACSAGSPEPGGDLTERLRRAAEDMLSTREGGSWIMVGESFFLVLLGAVVVGLKRLRGRVVMARGDARIIVLLTAVALLLRWMAHAGPSDIRAVIEEGGTRRAGWAALLRLIFDVLPRHDETIWTINRIVGALSVPLLYAVIRRRFADPMAAIAAAAALAVTPLIARFSASDTPYILLCAALLGAVIAFDQYAESGSMGALALALGLLTATLQLRPEGSWLIVPTTLVALAGGVPTDWRARLWRPSFALCALLFVALNVVATSWALTGNARHLTGFVLLGSVFGSPWADPDTTPRLLGLLVGLGAMAALLYRYRSSGTLWLMAVLVALPLDYPATILSSIMIDGHMAIASMPQYANARYHLPAMYLACGLAGLGVATFLDLLRRLLRRELPGARMIALGIVCLAALPGFDLLGRMWTPQREYELFRNGLAGVAPTCRVVTLLNGMDAGFVPFSYLAPGGLLDIDDLLADPSAEGCFIYYRSGNCYTLDLVPEGERAGFEMNPKCRAIEQRFRLEALVEAEVPAQAYRGEVYARNPLPLGFYRLREIGPGDSSTLTLPHGFILSRPALRCRRRIS